MAVAPAKKAADKKPAAADKKAKRTPDALEAFEGTRSRDR
jgi:hypothetical protein